MTERMDVAGTDVLADLEPGFDWHLDAREPAAWGLRRRRRGVDGARVGPAAFELRRVTRLALSRRSIISDMKRS